MRNKRKRSRPYAERLKEMRSLYQGKPPKGRDVRWAVLRCYFRKGLTIADTADILGQSVGDINFEIDTARQDAQ